MENLEKKLSMIREELNLEGLYLKHMISETDKDIDIVISKIDFNKIIFPENYKIIRKKLFFNNHVFVVRIDRETSRLSLLDFHVSGLWYCNVFKIPFDEIKNNSVDITDSQVYVLNKKYFYLDRYLSYIFFKGKEKRTWDYMKNNEMPIDFLCEKLNIKEDEIKKFELIKNKLIKNKLINFILYKIFSLPKISRKVKVALIGVDGSGKSSTICELEKRLYCLKFSTHYMGWKNFIFPPVKVYEKFIGSKRNEKNKSLNHSNIKKFSFLSLFVFYAELYLRYLRSLISGKDVVIYDRFFYDRLTRPKTEFCYNVFSSFTPSVNLVFYMTAPAEILYQRKKEISISYIEQMQSAFEKKGDSIKYKKIDTYKKSQEEVVDNIVEEIFNYLPNEVYKFKS